MLVKKLILTIASTEAITWMHSQVQGRQRDRQDGAGGTWAHHSAPTDGVSIPDKSNTESPNQMTQGLNVTGWVTALFIDLLHMVLAKHNKKINKF
jgi:hypothetical protein